MRAWIENDDDINPYIQIDVFEDDEMVESYGMKCRPLPWRMELDDIDTILQSPSAGGQEDDR